MEKVAVGLNNQKVIFDAIKKQIELYNSIHLNIKLNNYKIHDIFEFHNNIKGLIENKIKNYDNSLLYIEFNIHNRSWLNIYYNYENLELLKI